MLPSLPHLKIVDVGARSEGDEPPYAALLKAAPCNIYGFEPDAAELEKLNSARKDGQYFLSYVVGTDRSTRSMNVIFQRLHPYSHPIPSSWRNSNSSKN